MPRTPTVGHEPSPLVPPAFSPGARGGFRNPGERRSASPADTYFALTGMARPIAGQVQQGALSSFFDVSQSGVLIYEPASGAPTVTQLAWFDRTRKKVASIGVPAIHFDVRLSPDARRLASSAGVPKSEMWIDDLQRGVRMRLTFDPDTDNGIPVWSPDGSSLLFSTLRGSKAGVGIFRKASNGAGGQELVLPSDRPDREAWATDWSRDGRFLLFSRGDMANRYDADIWVLALTGGRKPIPFLHAAGAAYDAQFSPDERWVAYTSRESGKAQVYVAPFDAAKFLSGAVTGGTPGGSGKSPATKARTPDGVGMARNSFTSGLKTPSWPWKSKEREPASTSAAANASLSHR
jgi:Tol biopolymer transport system component